jgi:hypothetical protein
VKSFEEFLSFVEYFVDVVADYKLRLRRLPRAVRAAAALDRGPGTQPDRVDRGTELPNTPRFKEALRDMAIRYNINIIGGSHPTRMPTATSSTSLRLPARRRDPRAAQDPPDAERGLLVEHRGRRRSTRSRPTAARSAC